MSLLDSITDTKSIKDEIVDLAKTLTETQLRLQQLVVRLDEREQRSEGLEARYEELERLCTEAVNSAKWLNAQNNDLQFKLDQSRPEVDRLLSARESAFKKLKHARKVIRDLLQERGDMSSPRTQGSLTQEEINEALNDDFQRDHSSSSSSNDSTSEKTVRIMRTPSVQSASPVPSSRGLTPEIKSTPNTAQAASLPASNVTHLSSSRSPSAFSSQYESLTNSDIRSPQRVADYSSPTSTVGSPNIWQIQYSKPPGSMLLTDGPISVPPESLNDTLGLDDDTMNSLESLMTSSDISMRLQITRLPTKITVAFVYDPFFAETRQQSCILDWGRQQTNTNLKRYILQHKEVDPIFHVFTFPAKQKTWFYVGAMNWSVIEVKEFWPFEGHLDSKKKILNKLCNRSRGRVDRTEMEKLLDDAQLRQVCVEIKGLKEDGDDFARRVFGNISTPLTDSRHAERSA